VRRPILALTTLVCFGLALPARAAGPTGDFQFVLPPGWRDIGPGSAQIADGIPQAVMLDAISGKYIAYYVDPRNTESVRASFNAVSVPQTGRITAKELEQNRQGFIDAAAKQGLTMTIVESGVVEIAGVPAARLMSDVTQGQQRTRLLQYIIPGRRNSVALTYACPPEDFESYRDVFETAAAMTKGAYKSGGFDWPQFWIAGLAGGLGALLLGLVHKLRGGGPAQAHVPAPAVGEGSRECPACHRRVPTRIATCRCGQDLAGR
jgi:hypothetical protein